ncbi:class C sortase [Bifidobacterium vansinderenii]|nr:class C sortase [Bifidobacterium vansinderenii]
MYVVGGVMLLVALGLASYPAIMQTITGNQQVAVSNQLEKTVADWPYPKAEDELAAARDYNKRLFESGQRELGSTVKDAMDASAAVGTDDPLATEYEQRLAVDPGNAMGSVVIPKISVNIPILHGTSTEALNQGAGHTFGSSLPVGGPSTHAILAAHRGMPDKLMFTRLDEMRVGDFFQIKVMGETLSYQVTNIWTVTPDDFSHLKIKKGEDRVTLVTCTPYGINTHRLLVSGIRYYGKHPDPAKQPDKAGTWEKLIPIIAAMAVPLLSLTASILAWLIRKHKRNKRQLRELEAQAAAAR